MAMRPACRLVTFLSWRELSGFIFALGETDWQRLVECETIDAAREVMAGLSEAASEGVVRSVGREKILQIAEWT